MPLKKDLTTPLQKTATTSKPSSGMPELPAVEFTRRLIADSLTGKTIRSVQFVGKNGEAQLSADALIFSESAMQMLHSLPGKRLCKAIRWGKQLGLLFHDLNGDMLTLHLGMTGFVQAQGAARLPYESSPSNRKEPKHAEIREQSQEPDLAAVPKDWPPRFTKLLIDVVDRDNCFQQLAFADARRLARFDAVKFDANTPHPDPAARALRVRFNLGFDPILEMPPFAAFKSDLLRLATSRNLKVFLLDQSFVAGIGNWMADDILLEAGLHPSRPVNGLTDPEMKRLHAAIEEVSRIAVNANAIKADFPEHWIFHVRWTRKPPTHTLTGETLKFERIAGRSTFFAPRLQKRLSQRRLVAKTQV
jgi:formamidopyrimidine-DNA glycosylase